MTDHTRDDVALRVTRIEDTDARLITLRVEGRVVAAAVGLLEHECWRSLEEAPRVRVDFSGVTFIDGRGVDMLKRISAERLRVVNCSVFVEHLLYGAGDR
ncbi:MAG: STAS domain-containing protein [Candidatus Rokubacteria bacterium]|nr:STAS domain-containing protein [Candidatus Rokubacteria bacterium]